MDRSFAFPIWLFVASPVIAHHSDAGLDTDSLLPLEGTVVEYLWRNPHVYITVNAVDERGSEVEWTVEAGAVAAMSRGGWTRDSFTVGDAVNVEVHPARDGRPYGVLASIDSISKADGSGFIDERPQRILELNRVATSLEGVWIVDRTIGNHPNSTFDYFAQNLQLTEKARAAQSVYDEDSLQNPALNCIAHPEPFITILARVFPLEISLNEDDTALIRSATGSYTQTVFIDGRDHSTTRERSVEGYAVGSWEDDTLVVDTRRFSDHLDPYGIGVPSGAQKRVIHRYRLISGGTRLEVSFTLEDPEFLSAPLSDVREMIYVSGVEIAEADCDLESAQRFLSGA